MEKAKTPTDHIVLGNAEGQVSAKYTWDTWCRILPKCDWRQATLWVQSLCTEKQRVQFIGLEEKHSCGLVGPYAPEEQLCLRRSKHSKVNLRKKPKQTKKQINNQPKDPPETNRKPTNQTKTKTTNKKPKQTKHHQTQAETRKPITQNTKTTYKTRQ